MPHSFRIQVLPKLLLASHIAVALFMLLLVPLRNTTAADPVERRTTGDPYDLNGKRIVFTNWYYVRPGLYAWRDASGKNVTVTKDPSLGPWDAQLTGTDVPRGIRIVAQPAKRIGPVIFAEGPWKKPGLQGQTLLAENGKLRLWASFSAPGNKTLACLFESVDGQTWKTPVLNLVEFEGSTANNLLPVAPQFVFIDPSAPDSERYKGVSADHLISRKKLEDFKKRRPDAWEHRADRGDLIFGIQGYVSPDGIHWKKLSDPLVIEHSDTHIIAEYNRRLKKYVLYTRTYFIGPQSPTVASAPSLESWLGDLGGSGRRAIGRSESHRFDEFPVSKLLIAPDSGMRPSESLYTNCKTTIPGAPDQHVMFPAVWDISKDTTRIVMASSHDGVVWNFLSGGDVLRTANFGRWDGGCVFTFPNLVELPNGDFVLPYKGYSVPHKYPRGQWQHNIGLALWPKGRIVALEAADRGEFATVRIIPPGRKLRINAVTERAGSIRVEVANRYGKPFAGHSFEDSSPIQGDQYRTPVRWGNRDDLGYEEGEPIILRFRMDRARLFSLDFE